jgi:hypothetical protein
MVLKKLLSKIGKQARTYIHPFYKNTGFLPNGDLIFESLI